MATKYNAQMEDSEGNVYLMATDLLKSTEELTANTVEGKTVDALVVKELNKNFGGVKFGITADGQPGYKKDGADTVIPFNVGMIRRNYTKHGAGNASTISYTPDTIDGYTLVLSGVEFLITTGEAYRINIDNTQTSYPSSTAGYTAVDISSYYVRTGAAYKIVDIDSGLTAKKEIDIPIVQGYKMIACVIHGTNLQANVTNTYKYLRCDLTDKINLTCQQFTSGTYYLRGLYLPG